jgi:hypothetical protein
MAVEGNVGHGIRGQGSPRQIAALAARQHGVVSRAQLLGLGLGQGAIDHRVGRGLLYPVHRGVYAVGHSVLGPRGQWLAAVLAAGPGAVLSHSSAAALWGIRDAEGARPEVTVARRRRLTSVTTHRIALAEDEITINDGIPVTTPARTLLDLAEQLTPQRLERAVHEAEYRRLTSPLSLDALLTRHQGRRGTAALRMIVDRRDPAGHARRPSSRSRSWPSSTPTTSSGRESTSPSALTPSTPSGPTSSWSPSSMAAKPTRPRRPSRTTAPATATCKSGATESCASPGATSTKTSAPSRLSSEPYSPDDDPSGASRPGGAQMSRSCMASTCGRFTSAAYVLWSYGARSA